MINLQTQVMPQEAEAGQKEAKRLAAQKEAEIEEMEKTANRHRCYSTLENHSCCESPLIPILGHMPHMKI